MAGVSSESLTQLLWRSLMETDACELAVLTDEELDGVTGGADVSKLNVQDFVYNKIGMCGCGLAH